MNNETGHPFADKSWHTDGLMIREGLSGEEMALVLGDESEDRLKRLRAISLVPHMVRLLEFIIEQETSETLVAETAQALLDHIEDGPTHRTQ